jgi:hypothetical protein
LRRDADWLARQQRLNLQGIHDFFSKVVIIGNCVGNLRLIRYSRDALGPGAEFVYRVKVVVPLIPLVVIVFLKPLPVIAPV